MKRKIVTKIVVCLFLTALAFGVYQCQGRGAKITEDSIVRVGRTILDDDTFKAFQGAVRAYPAALPHYFPGQRQLVSFMVESEAVYQYASAEARAKVRAVHESMESSLDWKWKKRFYASILFREHLRTNLEFTDAELKAHYKSNPEAYRTIVTDMSGNPHRDASGRRTDSTFIPAFEDIKRRVANNLFYEKYKPDSAFLTMLRQQFHASHLDSAAIRAHWIRSVSSVPAASHFYTRRFFYEQTGEVYNEDEQQLLGDYRPLSQDDLEVIRSWLPEGHPDGRGGMPARELLEYLYQWKVFAERAEKMRLTSGPEHKNTLHWAMRIEFALSYLNEAVLPDSEPEFSSADTTLAELIRSDQTRPRSISHELDNIGRIRVGAVVDSAMHAIRRRVGVTFFRDDPEYSDHRDGNPVALFAEADSLKEAALTLSDDAAKAVMDEAERLFRILATYFAFTDEGRKAMGELASMQLEKFSVEEQNWQFSTAIDLYRRAQILETDIEDLCGHHFLVGFAYEEYRENLSAAEANYKWILRHAPNCTLASDAEFVIQNLGEPMMSIEEIRGQSLRQGRKVDFEEEPASNEGGGAN
ncbi:MAG: hypothetical protein LBU70_00600 [Chitinispirillales bacterium]|jgi:hypothetical protein|nr:hypothetical protein [Chitinispirillales bacterium]